MTTKKQIQTQIKNKAIFNAYQKMVQDETKMSKAEFCKQNNTSNRSLNRILEDADKYKSAHHKKEAEESTKVKESKNLSDPIKSTSESTGETVKKTIALKETSSTTGKPLADKEKATVKYPENTKVESPAVEEDLDIISWTVVKGGFISVVLTTGETVSVDKDHPEHSDIIHNLAIENYKEVILSMSLKHKVEAITSGSFVISDTGLTFNGKPVKGTIADDVVILFLREEPFEHLLKFYENLLTTASEQIFTDLWKLISHSGVTITEEGYVECFKLVTDDYKDCRTGKIDNSVGTTVTMRRTEVNDNRNVTCSTGLHVCAHQYLKSCFGTDGRIVKVVVRPQDFVSIPTDYKFTKARTCQYVVVADVTEAYHAGKFKNKGNRMTHKEEIDKGAKYKVTIRDRDSGKTVTVDLYDVFEAFGITCSAMCHAIKKLMMAGKRGAKDFNKDCNEAINSVEQSQLLQKYRIEDEPF